MAASPALPTPWRIEFDRAAQIKAAIIAVAFVAVFYNLLTDLAVQWYDSPDWSHGPLIPLFSGYLVYLNWNRIRSEPIRYTWVGFGLIVVGLLFYLYALVWSLFHYAQNLAMMLTLLGVIVALCGLPVMRRTWVPFLYLFFAIPLPQTIYFALTDPLRRIAAWVATSFLKLILVDIHQEGSTIRYYHDGKDGKLEVADACSGMRSTITLCALGVAITFAAPRPTWQRVVLIAACVPIAVFSNFIRVATTCVLHIFVDPKYAEGAYHTMLGLVTLLIAFMLFNGLAWVLSNLMVADDETALPEAAK